MDFDHRIVLGTTSMFRSLIRSSVYCNTQEVISYRRKDGTLQVGRNFGIISTLQVVLETALQLCVYSASSLA